MSDHPFCEIVPFTPEFTLITWFLFFQPVQSMTHVWGHFCCLCVTSLWLLLLSDSLKYVKSRVIVLQNQQYLGRAEEPLPNNLLLPLMLKKSWFCCFLCHTWPRPDWAGGCLPFSAGAGSVCAWGVWGDLHKMVVQDVISKPQNKL